MIKKIISTLENFKPQRIKTKKQLITWKLKLENRKTEL